MSTRIHALSDYLIAVTLTLAPWLFGFDRDGDAAWVVLVLGAGLIGYSLCTDYALGAVRKLPLRTHLTFDAIAGTFLLTSPWLFGFADAVAWPHVVLGLVWTGSALAMTNLPAGGVGRPAPAAWNDRARAVATSWPREAKRLPDNRFLGSFRKNVHRRGPKRRHDQRMRHSQEY